MSDSRLLVTDERGGYVCGREGEECDAEAAQNAELLGVLHQYGARSAAWQ